MLTEDVFSSLSMQAKVLYGVLLDRMTLSRKNAWFDEENRVFIIYQIGEIQEDLGFSRKKAMDLLSELEAFGLLEKKRRGHGLPNILYVKSFMTGLDAAGVDTGVSAFEKNDTEVNTGVSIIGKNDARGDQSGTSSLKTGVSRSAETGTSRSDGFGTSRVPLPEPLVEGITGRLF